jgi:hypothetical protein
MRRPGVNNRVYFALKNGKRSRFISFHIIDPDNVHIYFFGFNNKAPNLKGHFIERKNLTPNDIRHVTYKFDDLMYESEPKEVLYLSFHPKGFVFRVQLMGLPAEYLKTDTQVQNYIDFTLISDFPWNYPRTDELEKPNTIIQTDGDALYVIRGSVSLQDFDLRNHPYLGQKIRGDFSTQRGKISFAVFQAAKQSPDEHAKNRPRGTFANFLFPNRDDVYSAASFLVA